VFFPSPPFPALLWILACSCCANPDPFISGLLLMSPGCFSLFLVQRSPGVLLILFGVRLFFVLVLFPEPDSSSPPVPSDSSDFAWKIIFFLLYRRFFLLSDPGQPSLFIINRPNLFYTTVVLIFAGFHSPEAFEGCIFSFRSS